jgi:hypothetical protein
MTNQKIDVAQVILRQDGDWLVAYFHDAASSDFAFELGRVLKAIMRDDHRYRAFLDILASAVGDFLESRHGTRPEVEFMPLGDERAGRA